MFNLRVPQSWDARISQRILERLEVIQHTMTFAGLNEDYREMLLGEVAKRIEPGRLFGHAIRGEAVSDSAVDVDMSDSETEPNPPLSRLRRRS